MTEPRNVVGLDLSLRHTGVAFPSGDVTTIETHSLRGAQRWAHIHDEVACWMWSAPGTIDLAVIEGYAYAAVGSALFELCELGGLIRWELFRNSVPWLVVPPATLKKYATGKGGANKVAMVIAARERLGYEGTDDNQADALWLRALGLDLLGEPPCRLPVAQRNVLRNLSWPTGVVVPR